MLPRRRSYRVLAWLARRWGSSAGARRRRDRRSAIDLPGQAPVDLLLLWFVGTAVGMVEADQLKVAAVGGQSDARARPDRILH